MGEMASVARLSASGTAAFTSLAWDVEAMPDCPAKTKFKAKLEECETYFTNNQDVIVDYSDRYRHGEPIASGFVESAINQVVAKRFVTRQQMRWSDQNAHQLLQIRTAVLNDDNPEQLAEGVVHVFVNGTLAWTEQVANPSCNGRFPPRTRQS